MSSLEELISKADKEFEKAWEKQISISNNLAPPEETNIALRRLISYNPASEIIKDYDPELKKATEKIEKLAIDLTKQIANNTTNETLWVRLGHCYMLLNDYSNAHACYAQVKSLQPGLNDPYFWFSFGVVYQHFSYFHEALECYNMTTKCTTQINCPADFNYRLACLYRSLKKYDEALESFNSIKNDPPANLTTDDILFQIAYTNQLASNSEITYKMYKDLYLRHPDSLDVIQQFTWFISFLSHKEYLEYGKKIISSLPEDYAQNPRIKLSCARILMELDDLTESYDKFCKCLTFWNDNPVIWASLSELYFRNGQFDDALIALRRVLHLNPSVVEGWLNLAFICEKLNDKKAAMQVITAAHQKSPNSPEIMARFQDFQKGKTSPGMVPFRDMSYFSEIADRAGIRFINSSVEIPYEMIAIDPEIDEACKHLYRRCDSLFSH